MVSIIMSSIQVSFRDVLLSSSKSPCRLSLSLSLSHPTLFNSIIKQSNKHHREYIFIIIIHSLAASRCLVLLLLLLHHQINEISFFFIILSTTTSERIKIRWILCNHWDSRLLSPNMENFNFHVASNCQTVCCGWGKKISHRQDDGRNHQKSSSNVCDWWMSVEWKAKWSHALSYHHLACSMIYDVVVCTTPTGEKEGKRRSDENKTAECTRVLTIG